MKHEALVDAAGLVADGAEFDLMSLSSSLSSDDERAIADELAVIARIADAHRKLHQVLPAPPAVPDDAAPFASSWGHLDLIEVVGRGSYGTVYRAWDPRLDRLVALKLFHGARNPEAVMREGRMLARIRHEHVVTVHGADVHDGIAGIWMEYVHGRRLDQIVEQHGPFDAEEAALVGLAVCRALVAVHAAGVLHCDVKAQNVIREPSGRIVLMDFGAGRSTTPDEDSTSKMQVAGTPRYMAPEVFDKGAALPQSDVYSVGVLLFYLVTGRFPVDGHTLSEIRKAHLEGIRVQLGDLRPDLPPEFLRNVTRALDPHPAARHRTPGELEAGLLGVPLAGQRPSSAFVSRRRAIQLAAAAAALAVLAAAAGWRFGTGNTVGPPATGTRTVAVLPMRNLTGDPAKSYLVDGLTEVLISNLARVRALRVPPFAAVAGFRDTSEPSASIADKLGAELLLSGSVFEVGSLTRIMVNLIDPKTDAVIWAEERTPESSMLLAAHGDIARLLATYLQLRLSPDEERALTQRKIDPQAQEAYLRGVASAQSALDLTTATATIEHFRRAVNIDSEFAAAWAELADAEIKRINLTPNIDRLAAASVPRAQAERAIQLDPNLSAGYHAFGTVQFYYDWDFTAAERTFRQALTLAPSDTPVQYTFSMLLAALGRTDEAIEMAIEAQQLEPTTPVAASNLGIAYYYARDYDRAEAAMKRLLDMSPGHAVGHFGLGRIYAARGRYDDAIKELRDAVDTVKSPGYLGELARVLIVSGRERETQAVMDELSAREARGEGARVDSLAYIAAARGRLDDAFALLNQAIDRRLVNILWLGVDPRVDALRSDPRFDAVLSRIGLKQ